MKKNISLPEVGDTPATPGSFRFVLYTLPTAKLQTAFEHLVLACKEENIESTRSMPLQFARSRVYQELKRRKRRERRSGQ